MLGSWDFSQLKSEGLPQEVQTGFDTIINSGYCGSRVDAIKYLGSQPVNGVNHAILVKVTTSTRFPETHLAILIINQKGKLHEAKYTQVKMVDVKI